MSTGLAHIVNWTSDVLADADGARIERVHRPPALVGRRRISTGDEHALWPEEARALRGAVTSVQRQSGAARLTARTLLKCLGEPPSAIPRLASAAPVWPSGIVGSLAHDDAVAVAAIARSSDVAAIGVDVEPDAPLPPEMIDMVATPQERLRYSDDVLASRWLFVAKEAVFKASFSLDGVWLDFHDIEVDFKRGLALTNSGRQVIVQALAGSRLIVLASIDSDD